MLILAVNPPPNLIHSVFKGKCFIESEWSNLWSKDQNTFIQSKAGLNCTAVAMLVPAEILHLILFPQSSKEKLSSNLNGPTDGEKTMIYSFN